MSAFDLSTVEDASADEAKVSRQRESAKPDAGVVALLKQTIDTNPKKITLPNEDAVKELVRAIKVAAASEGIGYRVKVVGNVVFFKGAPKKNYTISADMAAQRAAKSAATRAAKKAESAKAHPAGKGK